jgi:transposase
VGADVLVTIECDDHNCGRFPRRILSANIEAKGAALCYLPPYSPDSNPIENAFAKAEARTPDRLWEAITDALTHFSAQECANYFAATGYEPT